MMQQEYEIIGNQNPDDLELAEVTNSQLGRWMNEAINRQSPSLFPNWVEESQAPLVDPEEPQDTPFATPHLSFLDSYLKSTPISRTRSLPDLTYLTTNST